MANSLGERLCQWPNCSIAISDLVSPEIIFCGYHQAYILNTARDYGLDDKTQQILLSHPHYSTSELAQLLGIKRGSISQQCRRGKIRAQKIGNPPKWFILPDEAARPFALYRPSLSSLQRDRILERARLEQLSPQDTHFLLSHPIYAIPALAQHLKVAQTTILRQIQSGRLRAKRRGKAREWQIPLEETVKLLVLYRKQVPLQEDWVSVHKASRILAITPNAFYKYAAQELLGPLKKAPSGILLMRKDRLAQIEQERKKSALSSCECLVHKGQDTWKSFNLQAEELMIPDAAKLLSVHRDTILLWINRDRLVAKRRGGWWVIKEADLREFAQRVLEGHYRTRLSYLERFRYFLGTAQDTL